MKQTKPEFNDDRVEFIMKIDLSNLIDINLEDLNDIADEYIRGFSPDIILTDINYEAVGIGKEKNDHFVKGFVFLKVNASFESI